MLIKYQKPFIRILGNTVPDTPVNFNTSVQSEKSNRRLPKIEKYISKKYDEVVLKQLK